MVLNFDGVIDFTKYTLALAAAAFIYVIEKFTPAATSGGRAVTVGLLVVLLASSISGVLVLAASTAAPHANDVRKQRIIGLVGRFGTTHAVLLVAGLFGVGGLVFNQALSQPDDPPVTRCVCSVEEGPRLDEPPPPAE